MAGLREVCTHIVALLFYLEALHRVEEVKTCTQQQCEWIIPSALKTVEYLPIKHIDFTSAQGKKRKLDEILEGNEAGWLAGLLTKSRYKISNLIRMEVFEFSFHLTKVQRYYSSTNAFKLVFSAKACCGF